MHIRAIEGMKSVGVSLTSDEEKTALGLSKGPYFAVTSTVYDGGRLDSLLYRELSWTAWN